MNIQKILEYYDINNDGTIYSKRNGRLLKLNLKKNGYVYVQLNINGKSQWFRVHRLIAEVHIPNPNNKPYVNHKDGNKSKNDYSNLEWVTGSENNIHAIDIGLVKFKLNTYSIYKDNVFIANIVGLADVACFIGCSVSTVLTSRHKPTRYGYSAIPLNV